MIITFQKVDKQIIKRSLNMFSSILFLTINGIENDNNKINVFLNKTSFTNNNTGKSIKVLRKYNLNNKVITSITIAIYNVISGEYPILRKRYDIGSMSICRVPTTI